MLHKQLWLASLEAPDDKYVSNFKQNYWLSCLLLIIPTEFRNYSQGSNWIINFNIQVKDFTDKFPLFKKSNLKSKYLMTKTILNIWRRMHSQIVEINEKDDHTWNIWSCYFEWKIYIFIYNFESGHCIVEMLSSI